MPYSADFKIKAFPFFRLLGAKLKLLCIQAVLLPQFSVPADPVIDFKNHIVYDKQKKTGCGGKHGILAMYSRNKEYVVHYINTADGNQKNN